MPLARCAAASRATATSPLMVDTRWGAAIGCSCSASRACSERPAKNPQITAAATRAMMIAARTRRQDLMARPRLDECSRAASFGPLQAHRCLGRGRAVLVLRLEDLSRKPVEQRGTARQPFGGLGGERRAARIKLADLLKPRPKLLQVFIVLLELGIGEFSGGALARDLRLEPLAALDEFLIGLVAIGIESRQYLLLLRTVERHCFQKDCFAPHPGDLVLDHLELAPMLIRARQDADAILQIDRTQCFDPSPQRDALAHRMGRDFVGEEKPGLRYHGFILV